MSTINDRSIIERLIKENGHFEDDPQAYTVWSYENSWGDLTQAVFYVNVNDMHTSQYVNNPKLLWSRATGITADGQAWLKESK